jgi:thiol-disulfide isomerase/thioredoxin
MGSTREQVIAEFGPPRGSTKAGSKEILTYRQGRVVLVLGQVSEVTMAAMPPPASVAVAPVPGGPAKTATAPEAMAQRTQALNQVLTGPGAQTANDPWLLDFEAARDKKRILILFTGTDWCGPCQEFQARVAQNPQFLKMFSPSFVFLRINWLRSTPQPPAEAAQAARLRQQYGIASFPFLLVLAADGTQLTRVDTRKGRPASGPADYFIQAIDEARLATRDGPPAKSSW